jgi:hypothetical protein
MPASELDEVRKKMQRPLPMAGIERKVTAAVLLSLALGLVCAVVLRDWQWFERSGSLVILVGIGLAWKDLVSVVGEVDRLYQGQVKTLKARVETVRPRGLINAAVQADNAESVALPDGSRTSLDEFATEMAALTKLLRKRLRTIEAVVLGIGTIVWGYGAPVGNLVWALKDA